MIFRLKSLLILSVTACIFLCTPSAFAEGRRNVELEWDAIEGATMYEVQVIRKDGASKKPMRFKSKDPKWFATINPGLYSMQIRSFDDRGAPGRWSPPTDLRVKLSSVVQLSPKSGESIDSDQDKVQQTPLRWEAVRGAERYKVTIRSASSSWHAENEIKATEWTVSTPVAESFEWNVTAVDPVGEVGDANAKASPFDVIGPALSKPSLQKPLSKYVEEVKWNQPPNSNRFAYKLSYKNGETNNWENLDEKEDYPENQIKMDISRPTGTYRLKVVALADRRKPSPEAEIEFEAKGGFKDAAALHAAVMRDSMSKPTSYYAIASYLIAQIQYDSQNHDTNLISTFKAIGGTGRVGVGYHKDESEWGAFGILDYSGFEIGGKAYRFASVEGHLTRKLEFGQGGLLLVGTGLFSKELPVVAGSKVTGFQGVAKIRDIGPHVGGSYWLPLTQRLGLQTNARAYYTLMGSTSTGTKVLPSLSYQWGVLGTYRLSPLWMGYAGYAYRKDQAEYSAKTGDPTGSGRAGDINKVMLQGDYLNLILEYSF